MHVVPSRCACMLCHHIVHACCALTLCMHVVPSCCACMLCPHVVHACCACMLCPHVVHACCARTQYPHVVHACCALTFCMQVVPSRACRLCTLCLLHADAPLGFLVHGIHCRHAVYTKLPYCLVVSRGHTLHVEWGVAMRDELPSLTPMHQQLAHTCPTMHRVHIK